MKRNKNKSRTPKSKSAIYVKDGPNFREVELSPCDLAAQDACFLYFITREEIEECDTTRLLHDLRPEPNNPFLMAGPGSVIFGVEGYDEAPRDLLLIPEFRAFARKIQENSPCWLYFALPEGGWLRTIFAASNSQTVIKVSPDGFLRIGLSPFGIDGFMDSQINEYERLCKDMGIDQDTIDAHLRTSANDSFPNYWPSSMMR